MAASRYIRQFLPDHNRSNTFTPVKAGLTGSKFFQSIFALFPVPLRRASNCFTDFLFQNRFSVYRIPGSMFSRKGVFCISLNRLPATVTLRDASSTCTTPLSYSGAIFTAVCIREVVAPPIIRGDSKLRLFISWATCTISSREGVINPLRPMISTFSFIAVSRILSAGHHHTKINNIITITTQHNTNNIFTNIMHISFYCCQ